MPIKSGSSKKKLIFITAILILIIFIFVGCKLMSQDHSKQIDHKKNDFTFQSIVDSWNRYDTKKSIMLIGEDKTSNKALCEKMIKLSKAFNYSDKDFEADIKKLKDEVPVSSFFEYDEFRKKHFQNDKLAINEKMKAADVALNLNKFAKCSTDERSSNYPNYLLPATVETFIFMNNFCAYFEANKKRFHSKNIDSKVNTCQELKTNGAYPSFDKLIDQKLY